MNFSVCLRRGLSTGVALLSVALHAAEIPVRVNVDLDHPSHAVSPMLHGVFFEDINYGADGGLYAELVQNRSFEHAEHEFAWGTVARNAQGSVTIETDTPLNSKNPHFARLEVREPGDGFGLANYGYAGITLRRGEHYLLTFQARSNSAAVLHARIEDETGRILGEADLGALNSAWKKKEVTLTSTGSTAHGRLVILMTSAGRTDLDMVSLFPEATFKHRRNGVRADLAQILVDLKPSFMRFPGGCIVEGRDLPNRYQWKDTIGDIAERPENWNRWQDALQNSPAPQYYQTYGLGFFEYFQFCEDIGAEPVPILNCGMACQYQSKQLVGLDQLDPFVQDALDLIEFANGPTTSTWGAKRAAMGHPEPFHLKFIGVGNEQWGEEYFERYTIFARALRAAYPEIKLVSSAGPGVDDQSWALAWSKFRSGATADVVDEHYYRPPQWFLENATRYDAQDRKGPKVFAGEFAAHDANGRSTLRAAVSEAAFMTGLIRNSDLVAMSSYAPLFAREGAMQWQPDLIWFDNTRVYGTASYHVQALFSRNRPDVVLPAIVEGEPLTLAPLPERKPDAYTTPLASFKPRHIPTLYAAAGRADVTGETVVFLVNPFAEPRALSLTLSSGKAAANSTLNARAFVLTGASPDDVNSFTEPQKISPREEPVAVTNGAVHRTLPPFSLTVMRIPTRL
jgi:alpha-L-arabinofuranosidase